MIDERKEELASLYALHLLEPEDILTFEAELRGDDELRELVADLQHHAAALVHVTPEKTAPAHLRAKILRNFRSENEAAGQVERKIRQSGPAIAFPRPAIWLPWALAAGLAIFCGLLFNDSTKLKSQIAELENQNDSCEIKVAMLDSMVDSTRHGVAIVAWDGMKQQGVIKVQNMPRPAANEDYQLWIVDPEYSQPVSAGVLSVDASGTGNVMFKPGRPVNSADKFAVSLERKGGVPQREGSIVMLSK